MNDPKAAAAYHPGDAPVTQPDLDALIKDAEGYAGMDEYPGAVLIRELAAALAAERARADQAASKAVHEYALALEQNRSAENWRWSDFVWDAHQWADSKSAAPTAEP